ncbi:hypothetical protein [Burkholderia phage BCSR5]|nr:hypothetical protein [Burkholderia phage BCSR5]
MFLSTKTYTHDVGLSCAFRQWRATHSHCCKLHGYAVQIGFKFAAHELDDKGWVTDFGGLKELKAELVNTFDHKTVVAKDDPELEWFMEAQRRGIMDVVVMEPGVGCERFAQFAFNVASRIIDEKYGDRVWVVECEVREHGGNSAIYTGESAVGAVMD